MSKHWEFRPCPIPDGKPKTLADVPEDVLCVVELESGELVFRKRQGTSGFGHSGYRVCEASTYKFISYIDGHRPPEQPKQWTIDTAPEGRCIQLRFAPACVIYWRANVGREDEHLVSKCPNGDVYTVGRDKHEPTEPVTLLPLIAELVDDPTGEQE